MNPDPKVSIVILNWNGRKYLEQFLPTVLQSATANAKVIVADNGSTDDSVDFLQKNFPQVRLILFTENYGFAKGYNEALKQIESDYYLLLNSDVETIPGWIEPMIRLLEENELIAACQPKLLNYADRNRFEYAGAAGGWIDKYGYPFARGRVFDVMETDQGQYDQSEPIFWASGAALFIRASVFHDHKGFDEYFFAHQEEIDLCWRIQLSGYQVYSCPSSVVYHVGGGTLHKSNSLKTFLNFRNNRIMLSKNLPFGRKLWVVPVRFFFDGVSAWKGLFSGDPRYFFAVIRAHFSFVGWWLFKRRKSPYPKSKKGILQGVFKGNVAWQHFGKGKKFFSEIVSKTE